MTAAWQKKSGKNQADAKSKAAAISKRNKKTK